MTSPSSTLQPRVPAGVWRWGRGVLLLLLALAVLSGSVYLGVRHFVWPRVDALRPLITAHLTRALGQSVEVGKLTSRWRGVNPLVVIEELSLRNAQGQVVLRVPNASAELSWQSLLRAELHFNRIVLEDAELAVERGDQEVWQVAGFIFRPGEPLDFLRWVLAQSEFELRGARLHFSDRSRPDSSARAGPALERRLEGLGLKLSNRGRSHRVLLEVARIGQEVDALRVEAELDHQRFAPVEGWEHWSGKMDIRAQQLDLAALAAHFELPGGVAGGVLAGEVALQFEPFRAGHPRTAQAELKLSGRDLALSAADEPITLQKMAIRARVALQETAWAVRLAQLELTDPSHLVLKLSSGGSDLVFDRADGRPRAGELVVDSFELADASHWLDRLPISVDWKARLRDQAPRATIRDARAQWSRSAEGQLSWAVDAAFERAALTARGRPSKGAPSGRLGDPGFENLAGRLQLDVRGGRLQITARDAVLVLPGLWAQPQVRFDQLSADVAWQFEGPIGHQTTLVKFNPVRFANADLAGELSGSWRSARAAALGIAELSGRLERAEGGQVARYLPLVLSEGLRSWIAGFVQAGRARDVRWRLAGPLHQFPFAKASEGTFRVDVPMQDARFMYGMRWPVAENIQGVLSFAGNGLSAKIDSASINGFRLSGVNLSIADFDHPLLRLEGGGAGAAQALIEFVQRSPLRDQFAAFDRKLQAGGDARLAVRLAIPIDALERTSVAGSVQLAGNSLVVDPAFPGLTQLGGRLEFTEQGFSLRDVRGVFLGGPIAFDTLMGASELGRNISAANATRSANAANAERPIQVTGAFSIAALRQIFEPGALRHLSGSARYQAQLSLQEQGIRVRLRSDLVGLLSSLPAPFAKTAEQSLPLSLDVDPLAAGEDVSLRLGSTAHFRVERRRDPATPVSKILRGVLAVGGEANLPDSGIALRVDSDLVDLDQWSKAFGDLGQSSSTDLGALMPSVVTLRARELVVAGRHLQDAVVGATRAAGYWRANVRSRGIDGYFNWHEALPGQPIGTVTARFGRLVIPESRRSDIASLLAEATPARLPGLDIAAETLVLGETDLGSLQLLASNSTVRNGGGVLEPVWQIDSLSLRPPGGKLSASGRWGGDGGRLEDRLTRLQVDLEVEDSARLLAAFGLVDVIRAGAGRVTGELSWRGPPTAFESRTLGGQIALEIGRGQFLKADPGLAKLIGVLNLQSLPRRLSLDFSDVFAEGFAFDRISGRVTLKDGIARTEDLRMLGVSALVAIRGSADIARETQNLTVQVVPQLNAGLGALAYAAAVNPAIGLGSLAAQFFLREPLQALFAYTVDVRGPWADPLVVRRAAGKAATSLK